MHPMLNIATQAVRNAGKIVVRFMDHLDASDISEKRRNELVTKVDQLAEQEIVSCIQKSYPNHCILAHASGITPVKNEYCWIIDALDGANNYEHCFPHFSISIALKKQDKLLVGLVYDPLRQELFTASRGQGAQLNNRKIRVSNCKKLENALIGTGFPIKKTQHFKFYLNTFELLFPKTGGVRRAGSPALDLAYVAMGRLDGFWEVSLNPWDMAAGTLLVTEAGGLVGDFHNENNYLDSGNIIAGSPKIYKNMLEIVAQSLKD